MTALKSFFFDPHDVKTAKGFQFRLFLFLLFSTLIAIDHRIHWDWMYTHWLYDYHFGFVKRGLVGEILRHLIPGPQVPLEVVKALGWALWSIVALFFFYFFSVVYRELRTHEEKERLFAFFIFCCLCPIGLRNYALDLGRLDQIGLLLLFLQWFHPPALLTAMLTIIAVFVHEAFVFMFLPAVLLIVHRTQGFKGSIPVSVAAFAAVSIVVLHGQPDAPVEIFWQYMNGKATSPLNNTADLLYRNLWQQFLINTEANKGQLPYLWQYLANAIFLIPSAVLVSRFPLKAFESFLRLSILLGYAIVAILACDWGRETSNAFFVCTFLSLLFLREPEFKSRFMQFKVLDTKTLYRGAFVSVLLPAAGIELPRITKFYRFLISWLI